MLAEKLQEAAGNGADATLYVDDVFSTYLFQTSPTSQTITTNIDMTKGALTWIKNRTNNSFDHILQTSAGTTGVLSSNQTVGAYTGSYRIAESTTGFTMGTDYYVTTPNPAVVWTFRKAAKFFDVVTYTGDGSSHHSIPHSLGSVPGMIIVKRTDTTSNWAVYHTELGIGTIYLNTTAAYFVDTTIWDGSPSATTFSVNTNSIVNASGGTYVAYLFAHDTASDGIIQCGSYTGNGSANGPTVNLGWEPQYVMVKAATTAISWYVVDSMRGMTANQSGSSAILSPNISDAEVSGVDGVVPNALGFSLASTSNAFNGSGQTYIYMAIRRPNKPPTSGTQVYYPVARSGTGATGSSTSFGQVTDLVFTKQRGSTQTWAWTDRLRGATLELTSAATTAETAYANDLTGFDIMTGFYFGSGASGQMNTSGSTYDDHLFRRAPGFFDEVCWTADATYALQNHNLTVVPELVIQKQRNGTSNWFVFNGASIGYLELTDAFFSFSRTLTNTTFQPASTGAGNTYVAYLFATLAGISKVGSYTGNGTTQTINCGFTGGARFVLIKRTDSTGDWYVFDTARGMTTLTDPYLLLNSTAAEVATLGAVTSVTTGFAVNAAIVAAINTNAASYIYLSVA